MVSAVGRRIAKAMKDFADRDYESAATAVFQAIDATASMRFPGQRVGDRFRGLITEQEDIVTATAIGSVWVGLTVNGVSLSDAIWKFGRNPLIHEGELDRRLSFENESSVAIGCRWNLPPSYLVGLAVAVISAMENNDETEVVLGGISFMGVPLDLQSLWGGEAFLRAIISAQLRGV